MNARVDLNCDMGESFGAYQIGADEDVFPYITSANVACARHGLSLQWSSALSIGLLELGQR